MTGLHLLSRLAYTTLMLLVAGSLLVDLPNASAADVGATAEDDTFTVRGDLSAEPTRKARGANTPRPSGQIIQNCVPLDEGRLRCYTADETTPGVLAVSVDDAAGNAVTQAEIDAAVVTEFRRLPIAPGGIVVQPSQGWSLVNLETIVHTAGEAQTFSTSVLGIPVDVRATPVRYSWSFGDGSAPLVTADPGSPWPEPTVTHSYATTGTHIIGLATQWAGEYQIGGSASWQAIDGFATTTESAPPLEVRSAENALVTAP